MTKSFIKSTLFGLLAVALAGLPATVAAKDTNAPALEKKAAKETKTKKITKLPFHGKLKAVDKVAKTITVGERTMQITSDTLITKGDKPATLDDGVVGEDAGGSYRKGEDGSLSLVKLRLGAKADKETKKEKSKKD